MQSISFTTKPNFYQARRWLNSSVISGISLLLVSCTSTPRSSLAQTEEQPQTKVQVTPERQAPYSEKYRPQFHYSPKSGWIGDPDGLVYYDGFYHLFNWPHSISKDLVHWTELPWPMLEDDGSFQYFSGSIVIDKNNTAGFGPNSMVAAYTMNRPDGSLETVGLSSSQDYTDFHFFKGNPVLDIHSNDFRDPQVFWHEPTKRWIMVIALPGPRKIAFYSSTNLKSWQHLSDFGNVGARGKIWECPDLFPLFVDGDPKRVKWVLMVSTNPNRVQYFLGNFDGQQFTLDDETTAYLNEETDTAGTVFVDFNGATFGNWAATGTAFNNGPSHSDAVAHLGAGFADSIGSGDPATGTLTSPEFKITQKAINFKIAGGVHPDQLGVRLLVDGKVVHSTTGDGTGVLKWHGWDVADIVGQTAQIQLVDSYTGGDFGHFMLDQIVFSDAVKQEPRGQNQGERALWADYGTDFYAARSWRDIDQVKNRTVWLGWLGNYDYAQDVPTTWGRGFESIPRELSLKTFPEGVRLVQTPIPELESLRGKPTYLANHPLKQGEENLAGFSPARNTYEIEAEFAVTQPDANFGFNLLVGEGRKLVLGYDAKNSELFLDRTHTSDFTTNQTFNNNFPITVTAPLELKDKTLKLHIFMDQSSIEVLADSGKVVLSSLTFPSENQTGIQFFSQSGGAQLVSLNAWELKSIWNNDVKAIPGILEAEDFDKGGEGIGFHDLDTQNKGGKYRPEEGVDIIERSGGGFNVAWMAPKEWLAYTIKVDYNRQYVVTSQVSGKGGQFHLELDGKDVTGPVKVPATATQKWTNVAQRTVIPFGEHQLRFCVDAGNFDLDKMTVSTVGGDIVSGGTYQLAERQSGRVLDASGTEDGAAIQQWESLGSANQQWKIEDVGDGCYKLTEQRSGKVLTVNGNQNGIPALQSSWQNNDDQKWNIHEVGGGYYTISHKNGGKVLEVDSASMQNGGKVQQWEYIGSASQQWKLKLLDRNP